MVISTGLSRALLVGAAALLFALPTAAQAQQGPSANIIGGAPVPSDASYPYLAAVLGKADPVNGFFCGGTLIAPRWVLTAAHCLAPLAGIVPKYVGIGARDRSNPALQMIPVTSYLRHPSYDETALQNDVMLLRLASAPVGITPLPRATAAQDPPNGASATTVGWGLTVQNPVESDTPPLIAREADTEIVSNASCATAWSEVSQVIASQICTQHTSPTYKSGCKGDSGGPLIFGNRQVGIVSYGTAGCTDNAPSVYTRVSSYQQWIDGTTQKTLSLPNSVLDFGTVDTDGHSNVLPITVVSDGELPIAITGTNITGDFVVQSSTCAGVMAPGQSCTLEVAFDPSASGLRYGSLKLTTDSAGTSTYAMQLKGNGFGRSRVPVKLNVKRKKLKLYGGHVKATYRMSFKVPSGITAKYACTGKLGSSVSVSGRKSKNRTRIYALPGKIGRPPHCYSDFRVKLPARALGRKAKFELKFPANEVLVDSRRIVRLRIN